MREVWAVSLISGPVPLTVTALGGLGLLWLLIRRKRRYLLLIAPACIVAGVAVTALGWLVIEKIWQPFPDPLPEQLYAFIGLAIIACLIAVFRVGRPVQAATVCISVGALVLVLATSALHINAEFGAYPTIGALIGESGGVVIATAEVIGHKARQTVPVEKWKAPPGLPPAGKRLTSDIPGSVSKFDARPAEIYLPPAYFSDPRPLLPVIVLLAGQPGKPEDWLEGGRLIETMDNYVADHSGLAPIIVVADGTGSLMANPLCVDSSLGNVATYLSTDVPQWIRANLEVDSDPKGWAIGGLSYGGTCSLQLATNYPAVFPTFLDMSGQLEPTLGDRQRTLAAAFGGNAAAFAAVNPIDLMRKQRYPESAGAFVVGTNDTHYRQGVIELFHAAQAAGMNVHFSEVEGGHSFVVWALGFEQQLPWLSHRLGLPG